MLHMGRVGGGIGGGGVQGQGLGQGNDPASMGNANMSAFTGMPAMANHSGGGGEMTGSNGMQMMSSNMLGQHSYGADPRGPQAQAQGSMPIQGQEPMLSSATGVQGPMIGGGWAGYGS